MPSFELAPHNKLIIQNLEAVERGEINRLMIFMPPRHGKSLLTTMIFPGWYLGRHPERNVITTTYSRTFPMILDGACATWSSIRCTAPFSQTS